MAQYCEFHLGCFDEKAAGDHMQQTKKLELPNWRAVFAIDALCLLTVPQIFHVKNDGLTA